MSRIGLHSVIDALKGGGCIGPDGMALENDRSIAPVVRWLLKEARDAVCFDMGDMRTLPHLKLIPELFVMPYDVTWLEGELEDGRLGVLASRPSDDIHTMAIFNLRHGSSNWLLCGVVDVFQESGDLRIRPRLSMEPAGQSWDDPMSYLSRIVGGVACFVMAINCKNVCREHHQPPKFASAQRAKKGKQPLFSYWTLHLPSESSESAELGGTHASPRVHLRRGHIRQFTPGRYTWVNAHVVGDPKQGMVMKDYALKTEKPSLKPAVSDGDTTWQHFADEGKPQ